jgi:hypothetical protein
VIIGRAEQLVAGAGTNESARRAAQTILEAALVIQRALRDPPAHDVARHRR